MTAIQSKSLGATFSSFCVTRIGESGISAGSTTTLSLDVFYTTKQFTKHLVMKWNIGYAVVDETIE